MRQIDADVLKEAFEVDGYLSPYIQRMIDACPTVNEWISVEDRLPKSFVMVLVFVETESMCAPMVDVWMGEYWLRHCDDKYKITHWMPIYVPPKEEDA